MDWRAYACVFLYSHHTQPQVAINDPVDFSMFSNRSLHGVTHSNALRSVNNTRYVTVSMDREARAYAEYQQFKSFRQAIQTSPHFQSQLIQLAPGALREQCDAFFAENYSLYRMQYNLSCMILGKLTLDGCVGLGVVEATAPSFFNGKKMQPQDCFILQKEGYNDLALPREGTLYVFVLSHDFMVKHAFQNDHSQCQQIIGKQEVVRLTHADNFQRQINDLFNRAHVNENERAVEQDLHTLAVYLAHTIAQRKLLHYRRNSRGNLLSKAVRFILQNTQNTDGCSYVAENIHTSSRSLEKVFRQYLNMSPREFINVAKLNCFHERLSHRNHHFCTKLSLLSSELGVSDYSAFSKLYKKFYGISPLQTRKRLTLEQQAGPQQKQEVTEHVTVP